MPAGAAGASAPALAMSPLLQSSSSRQASLQRGIAGRVRGLRGSFSGDLDPAVRRDADCQTDRHTLVSKDSGAASPGDSVSRSPESRARWQQQHTNPGPLTAEIELLRTGSHIAVTTHKP